MAEWLEMKGVDMQVEGSSPGRCYIIFKFFGDFFNFFGLALYSLNQNVCKTAKIAMIVLLVSSE